MLGKFPKSISEIAINSPKYFFYFHDEQIKVHLLPTCKQQFNWAINGKPSAISSLTKLTLIKRILLMKHIPTFV